MLARLERELNHGVFVDTESLKMNIESIFYHLGNNLNLPYLLLDIYRSSLSLIVVHSKI